MDHSDHRAEFFSTPPVSASPWPPLGPRCPHVEIGSLARSWVTWATWRGGGLPRGPECHCFRRHCCVGPLPHSIPPSVAPLRHARVQCSTFSETLWNWPALVDTLSA